MIRDLYTYTRGGPEFIYRVAIRRPQPDFELVAMAERERAKPDSQVQPAEPLLRPGGTASITVLAIRKDGFNDSISLTAKSLPQGVSCEDVVIGPGQKSGILVLKAKEDAPGWCGAIQVIGTATLGEERGVRTATSATVLWSVAGNDQIARRSRLTRNLMLAVTEKERETCVVQLGEKPIVESETGNQGPTADQASARGWGETPNQAHTGRHAT